MTLSNELTLWKQRSMDSECRWEICDFFPAQTRSISAENFDGSKGKAGMAAEGTGSVPAR